MRLPLLALFVTTLVACNSDNTLKRQCPETCFGISGISRGIYSEQHAEHIKDRAGVGECKAGTPICDKGNFNIIECNGEVLPAREVCDGLDNDCNRQIDDGMFNVVRGYPNETTDPCLSLGECSRGFEICRNAEWVCDYPETVSFGEELPQHCDGLDNNCDGRIDNIDLTCTDLLGNEVACSCYEGPVGTERHGECSLGFYECRNGEILCIGERRPTPEICDEKDNDCNGIVDDTESTLDVMYDIVFILDDSGSMCEEISSVAGAISTYVEQFSGDSNFKWAVVTMTDYQNRVTIRENFTDISDVQTTLATMGCSGGGAEASLDALWAVCTRNEDILSLNWREDAVAIIFAFTDEAPQTYFHPPTTGSMITDACLDNGVLPFQWSIHPGLFAPIVEPAGGEHFTLVNNWQQILIDLNSVVSKLCID